MMTSPTPEPNRLWTSSPVNFGCDPELFIAKAGRIIGSEKVINEKGLAYTADKLLYDKGSGTFVQDGVQIELNPAPKYCRGNLAMEMAAGFRALREHLKKLDGLSVSFRSVVEIDKAELDSLSDKAKLLGCAPSLNKYDKAATISVNPATYLKRSAGGHIHMGLANHLLPHCERLVPLLDILVGNTCVLLDRDPYAAERRKVYGRAGEYRLPAHGLEYRTLSNFWLKSYQLMSFVFGMARLANAVLHTTELPYSHTKAAGFGQSGVKWDAETALLNLVDLAAIRKAINNNDVELARKNYQQVKGFIATYTTDNMEAGLNKASLAAFDYFVHKIDEAGLDYWFPEDPLTHWCRLGMDNDAGQRNTHGIGFECFMVEVHKKMCAEAACEEYGQWLGSGVY